MLSMLDILNVVSDPSNLSFHIKLHCAAQLLRQKVVYISLTISMSLEHLHEDSVGCQLMKHAAQELMSYTGGSTRQVYIGLTLPWIAGTDSHSTTLNNFPYLCMQ
jgi:hypothetical protein